MFFEPRNVTEFYFDTPEQDRVTNRNPTEFKFRKRKYILDQLFLKVRPKIIKIVKKLLPAQRALLVH
jgi:hypothetical protein